MGKGKKRYKFDEAVKRIIKENHRVLVGLAHYDLGKKIEGCDCCHCQPIQEAH